MSIILFEIGRKNIHGIVYKDISGNGYIAKVYLLGMLVYWKRFQAENKAVQAVKRNIKRYI